jgi:hypothetical protein
LTTLQFNPIHENRIRPDIRAMLEYHILEDLPLKEACRRAGLKYTKNSSQAKSTKAGRAYVAQLKRRRRVIVEFGVDDPSLVSLIEIRDMALNAGSYVAAGKAQELCIRVATKAKADGKEVGSRKEVDEMTRAEIIEELRGIKLKADGKGFEVDEDLEVTELRESMGLTKKPQAMAER